MLIVGVPVASGSRDNGGSVLITLFSSLCKVWNFVGDAADLKGLTEMPLEELLPFLKLVFMTFIGFCLIKKAGAGYLQKKTDCVCVLRADAKLLPA